MAAAPESKVKVTLELGFPLLNRYARENSSSPNVSISGALLPYLPGADPGNVASPGGFVDPPRVHRASGFDGVGSVRVARNLFIGGVGGVVVGDGGYDGLGVGDGGCDGWDGAGVGEGNFS